MMEVLVGSQVDAKANLFPDPDRRMVEFLVQSLNHSTPLDGDSDPGYNRILLSRRFEKFLLESKNLEVFEDDVWVLSYPKCGTTWTQEMVWQISNDVKLDAGGLDIAERFPFLEFSGVAPFEFSPSSFEKVRNKPRPRFIKSHLPIKFLPAQLWTVKPKIFYVMRDPKDAAVSYFHHYSMFYQYSGSKEDFFDIFLNGNVEFGDYWSHLKQFSTLRNEPNFCFLRFESLKTDMRAQLKHVAQFLGKTLTENHLEVLESHLSFGSMKQNPRVNREDRMRKISEETGKQAAFMRKGQVGSFRDEMPPEYAEKLDRKTLERLSGLDLY